MNDLLEDAKISVLEPGAFAGKDIIVRLAVNVTVRLAVNVTAPAAEGLNDSLFVFDEDLEYRLPPMQREYYIKGRIIIEDDE